MPDHVESLALNERIEVYRQRAARMLRLAKQCETQGIRLAYLKLAAHWQDLIVDLERSRRTASSSHIAQADDAEEPLTDGP